MLAPYFINLNSPATHPNAITLNLPYISPLAHPLFPPPRGCTVQSLDLHGDQHPFKLRTRFYLYHAM